MHVTHLFITRNNKDNQNIHIIKNYLSPYIYSCNKPEIN